MCCFRLARMDLEHLLQYSTQMRLTASDRQTLSFAIEDWVFHTQPEVDFSLCHTSLVRKVGMCKVQTTQQLHQPREIPMLRLGDTERSRISR